MNIRGIVFNASIYSIALLPAVLIPAQQLDLHLRHGDYVQATRAAVHNGTPDTSGYVDKFTATRLAESRFKLTKAGRPAGIYRWCNASAPAVKSVKP